MLKIIAGGAVAALIMLATPSVGVAAQVDKSPGVRHATEQATEFSDRRRVRYVRRYYRPRYYAPYAYAPAPYYGPSYGYYGYPYRRGPGITFGFGF